jgi:hypothetical protein
MDTRPTKKQKKAKEELFRVTISAPSSFKTMCDILGSIFNELPLLIVHDQDFTGIKVHSMNDRQIAFIKLQYACPVQSNDEQQIRCCVPLKTFNQLLKHVPNTSVMHLIQYKESNEVVIETQDERASIREFYCNTLQMLDDNYTSLEDVESDNVIEFDLLYFKNDVKICKDTKATAIDFSLYKKNDSSDTLIVLFFKGDQSGAKSTYICRGKKVKVVDDDKINVADWEKKYASSFDADMLHSFLKNMDRESKIIVCLTKDMMIMDYNLGVENSHIRFYLAPKVDEEDEEIN